MTTRKLFSSKYLLSRPHHFLTAPIFSLIASVIHDTINFWVMNFVGNNPALAIRNDGSLVAANGTLIAWVNDDEAPEILIPEGGTTDDRNGVIIGTSINSSCPATFVHYVPSGSDISSSEITNIVEVIDPHENQRILKIANRNRHAVQSPALPNGVCYADYGCGVSLTTINETFISQPFTKSLVYIPGFSITPIKNSYVGTVCDTGRDGNCLKRNTSISLEETNIDTNESLEAMVTFRSDSVDDAIDKSPIDLVICLPTILNPSGRILKGSTSCVAGPDAMPIMSMSGGIAKYIDSSHEIIKNVFSPQECTDTRLCTVSGTWTADEADTYFHYMNNVVTGPAGSIPAQWIIQKKSWTVTVS